MKANINVTPLIDVLLVLLIIFMVVTPSRPSRFEARVPAEPEIKPEDVRDNPLTLLVTVGPNGTLRLNREPESGTVDDPAMLIASLNRVFEAREREGIIRHGTNLTEKTVFVRAPRSMNYGSVAKTIDAVKQSGAGPIGLRIDYDP